MGWLDKIMGRGKRAAGAMDDPGMREQGRDQEAAAAEERAAEHEDMAQEERERAAAERADQENL